MPKKQILLLFISAWCNKTANVVVCGVAHKLYQGVPYFLNIIQFHSTHINVISVTPMRNYGHSPWRSVYRILVGKPEGKRPPGRPKHKWENNIKMNLQVLACGASTGSL